MVCRVVLKPGLLLRRCLSYLARKIYIYIYIYVEFRILILLPTVTLLVNVMFVELYRLCAVRDVLVMFCMVYIRVVVSKEKLSLVWRCVLFWGSWRGE